MLPGGGGGWDPQMGVWLLKERRGYKPAEAGFGGGLSSMGGGIFEVDN